MDSTQALLRPQRPFRGQMILPPAFPPSPRHLAVISPCPVSTACPHSAQRRHGSRETQQAATGLSQLLSRTPRAPTLAAASQNQGCRASASAPSACPAPALNHRAISFSLPVSLAFRKGVASTGLHQLWPRKGGWGIWTFQVLKAGRILGNRRPLPASSLPAEPFHCPLASHPGATGCGCTFRQAPCASSPHWPDPQPLASGSSTPSLRL